MSYFTFVCKALHDQSMFRDIYTYRQNRHKVVDRLVVMSPNSLHFSLATQNRSTPTPTPS